ncbi:hypothetical protein [Chitinivibrio alkaliphilus]|uniref:Uncharacterized protein n=1 Tax=Chitinivibrio alkaliphilus ACht1 TaxID=1313304 RepID=U7D8U6_9BACT|nr:hypothetical protein [Chitinivibrio alkaliphilus]ERP39365.1 hypothetical protein CALK_0165 [Chitinivibrio alkaliphilus ACht1]
MHGKITYEELLLSAVTHRKKVQREKRIERLFRSFSQQRQIKEMYREGTS